MRVEGKKMGLCGGRTCPFNNVNSNNCHLGHLKVGQKEMEILLFSNLKEEGRLLFWGCEKGDECDNPRMLELH